MESFERKIQLEKQLEKFQVEKSIEGTEAFYIEQDLMKGVSQEEILEKAKSGIYSNTAQNRKAGRVGQKYGNERKEEGSRSSEKEVEHTHTLKESDKVRTAGGQLQRVVEINGNMVRLSGESDPVHISKLYRPDGSVVLSNKKTESQ